MIKIQNKKKFAAFVGVIALLIAGSIWGILKFKNRNNPENQQQVYEALVNIVDQKTSDPIEDARSSLKKGDVIAYFPEGHSWSDTEKNSYLIVKLKLKPADAAKMLEAETKPSLNLPLEGGEGKRGSNPETRQETVLARQYRLDLPSFDVQKFWEKQEQPFGDKIFGSSIIDKK